jgi:hypothetical protein
MQFSPRVRSISKIAILEMLLILLLLLSFPLGALFGLDEALGILMWSSPENPEAGSPWTVSILVDYPNPAEVRVTPPDLPPSLTMDQIRSLPGLSEGGERRTLVELQFIPRQGGVFTLPPFEVFAPGKRALTPALSLRVSGPAGAGGGNFSLAWDRPPAFLVVGEARTLSLGALDREGGSAPALPPGFRMEAPANAILEALPLDEAGREGGTVLRLRVIPLEGPALNLPALRFSYQGRTLDIPPLRVPVSPAAPAAGKPPGPAEAAAAGEPAGPVPAAGSAEAAPAFPRDPGKVFFPLRREYEALRGAARELWDRGRRAEALALLRRHERDTALGPFLVPLRRASEEALGLPPAADERWRPWKLLTGALLCVLMAAAGGVLIALCRRRPGAGKREGPGVTLSEPWGYKIIAVFFIILLGLALLGVSGGMIPLPRSGRTGALIPAYLETRRVPDPSGAPAAHFREGESALIRSVADSWVYVESPDGKAGWAPVGMIIPY